MGAVKDLDPLSPRVIGGLSSAFTVSRVVPDEEMNRHRGSCMGQAR